MLTDIDDAEIEANNANGGIGGSGSNLRNLNLKRALLRHRSKGRKTSSVLQRRLAHGGIVQSLLRSR